MKTSPYCPDVRIIHDDDEPATHETPTDRPTEDRSAELERRHARQLAAIGGRGVPYGLEQADVDEPTTDDAERAEREHAERIRSL